MLVSAKRWHICKFLNPCRDPFRGEIFLLCLVFPINFFSFKLYFTNLAFFGTEYIHSCIIFINVEQKHKSGYMGG